MNFNMTGKWELRKERSESMYPHMKAMGCDEIAALASEKLNIVLNIIQDNAANTIQIFQTSQLGTTKLTLSTAEETLVPSVQTGERRVNVTETTLDNEPVLIIETVFKNGAVRDIRMLVEGGLTLKTTLELTVKGHGPNPIRTTRYFQKVGDPDPEMMARAPQDDKQ